MNAAQHTYVAGETIAAIATPIGEGGIGVIRISGREALKVGNQIFSGKLLTYASHTAHLGTICTLQGEAIDRGLALVMHGPHSYTGEDTVELQCHGSLLGLEKVLAAAVEAGARVARPGEFTLKAFLNGKIDLTQAEAVAQLIGAQSDLAFQAASRQLEGRLQQRVKQFQKELLSIAALLEAWVDFPEEDLVFTSYEELTSRLERLKVDLAALIDTFGEGSKLDTQIVLCLLGPPNVGKSSLMNQLSGQEKAIVTSQPGTTRDMLEASITFGGLNLTLLDTAGISDAGCEIEQIGVERARRASTQSDLILLVLDATRPPPADLSDLSSSLESDTTVLLWNKVDLPHRGPLPSLGFQHVVELSAKTGAGIELFKEKVGQIVLGGGQLSRGEVVLTSQRHVEGLKEASRCLHELTQGLDQRLSPELLAADAKAALHALGQVVGIDVQEEVLSTIFANFCVGK